MKIKYLLCVLVMLCVTQASFAQIKSQQECFYDGQFSSSNIDMPSEMYPDQKGEVRVTLRNVGTCTWNPRDIELRVTIKKALVVLLFSSLWDRSSLLSGFI